MSDLQADLHLEIAHILFIDVVGYSKLLINEQSEAIRTLNQIVLQTAQVRTAEAAKQLIRLATGDGMELVFRNHPEAPAECALEIAEKLRAHPQVQVRMGVHSGPVNEITDVELGVANVLEGSVRRVADRVLLNVQLIDTATDQHIWAERYDRTLVRLHHAARRAGFGNREGVAVDAEPAGKSARRN